MRGIRSGRLKDFVHIQTSTDINGEYGGVQKTWATKTSRECDIEYKTGGENFVAQGENVIYTVEIRFRYEPGLINEQMRLVDPDRSPNRVFDIQGIIDPGNWGSEIVCTCTERRCPTRT